MKFRVWLAVPRPETMGNCLACFKDKRNNSRTDYEGSCKYQHAGRTDQSIAAGCRSPTTKDDVLHNNNYPITTSSLPPSGQYVEHRLTNRDVLDRTGEWASK